MRLEAIAGDPYWEAIRARLEDGSIPEPNSGCQLWFKAAMPQGYGNLTVRPRGHPKGRSEHAHCLSFAIHVGPIPDDAHVLHRCDVPACINPAHLYLGDDKQNAADRVARGREPDRKGEASPRAKLTDEQVRAIRVDPRPLRKIAAAYGVSKGPITAIKAGISWRHVT